MFKDKADLYIQGVHGGFGKELMLPKLQSILEKVVKDNSMSKAEALTFIQERNNFYKNFAEENPGGTLPRWEKADGGRIGFHRGKSVNTFESWLKNQIANNNTSFRTAQDLFKAAGAKSHGANQKIWNKYKDQFKITSGSRLGGNIVLKEEAIKKYLDNLDPTVKINVEQTVKEINKNLPKSEQISESLLYSRLNNPDFNTNNIKPRLWSDVSGKLSAEAQQAIKDSFDDVVKKWDFEKNKYGIPAGGRDDNKALYEQIRRFADSPQQWKYAYNLGSPDGWLLAQMDRAGYTPITEIIKGKEKIIGHIDPDGTKWVSADKWKSKHNASVIKNSHPDFKATKNLVDITKKTRALPNQTITEILTKGGVPVDGRLQLNHLLNYLIDEKGVDVTKSALQKHHVRGVKRSPTADLQLVTRIANQKANKIAHEIKSGVFDRIDVDDRLKKLGISLDVDGARYGGKGFETFKEVEGFVEKGLKGFDEKKFKSLKEALVRSNISPTTFQKFLNSAPVKLLKGVGKAGARTVGAAMPVIGPGMVAWGLSDVNKAHAAGLTNPDELAVAYNFGPEIAKMWSNYKGKEMKPTLAGTENMPVIDDYTAGVEIEEPKTYGKYANQIKDIKIP